uniref:Secreted protein n=1 Tax=Timema genevievae TaxID=629358 RepID=A0A7R9K9I9_TIMGE|nr:unnamed protein product [Timema genevievae]
MTRRLGNCISISLERVWKILAHVLLCVLQPEQPLGIPVAATGQVLRAQPLHTKDTRPLSIGLLTWGKSRRRRCQMKVLAPQVKL